MNLKTIAALAVASSCLVFTLPSVAAKTSDQSEAMSAAKPANKMCSADYRKNHFNFCKERAAVIASCRADDWNFKKINDNWLNRCIKNRLRDRGYNVDDDFFLLEG